MDRIKFLTDLNIQEIIAFLVEDKNIEYDEALDMFYKSTTFEKLADKQTGLYRESAAYVYELLKNEFKSGELISSEQ